MAQSPVSAVVREERRVLAPSTADQRATEREREMATLGAVVASSQYTQPVAILRNYTKTDWQHHLGHRAREHPASTNKRIKI